MGLYIDVARSPLFPTLAVRKPAMFRLNSPCVFPIMRLVRNLTRSSQSAVWRMNSSRAGIMTKPPQIWWTAYSQLPWDSHTYSLSDPRPESVPGTPISPPARSYSTSIDPNNICVSFLSELNICRFQVLPYGYPFWIPCSTPNHWTIKFSLLRKMTWGMS